MPMNRAQFHSIVAGGRRASRQTCAGQFLSVAKGGAATVVCPGSLPAYLPGGEFIRENSKSTRNLWISDRRGNLT